MISFKGHTNRIQTYVRTSYAGCGWYHKLHAKTPHLSEAEPQCLSVVQTDSRPWWSLPHHCHPLQQSDQVCSLKQQAYHQSSQNEMWWMPDHTAHACWMAVCTPLSPCPTSVLLLALTIYPLQTYAPDLGRYHCVLPMVTWMMMQPTIPNHHTLLLSFCLKNKRINICCFVISSKADKFYGSIFCCDPT